MRATVTDTGGLQLMPESDADRFILKRLMGKGQLYWERVSFLSGPNEHAMLWEVRLNIIEKRDAHA